MSKLLKILSLLFIVISMAINAQTSCNSPITSTVDTVCNYQNYYIPVGQGVSWHQFTGTGENVQINILQGFSVPGYVTKLALLDSCNGTILAMDSIVVGDSVLSLAIYTIVGNSYKLLVEKNDTTFDINYEICFFKLAEPKEHTLLICRDGKIEAFGDNSSGQLGSSCASDLSDIHHDYYNYFRILGITDTVVKVDVASSISMALTNKGDVYVWGANTNGVFGSLTPSSSSCPIQVQVCNIVDIALAENFAVAINTRGEVLTWGSNSSGQLGNGTTGGINSTPTKVTGISSAYKVDAGAAFVVVLDTTGRVYSWGSNGGGALGQNITTPVISSPALVRDGSNNVLRAIKDISSGETHTLALDSMNRLWVWGNNSSGQLGLAGANQFAALHLSAVDAVSKIDIAAGRDFSILITGNNTYMGSGYNVGGVITPVLTGNGYDCVGSINPNANAVKTSFFPQYTLPVPTGATKIIDIQTAGAFQHNTVIYDNGKAITWGRNFYSQLGRYAPKINSCADTAPFVQPRSYDAVTLSYNPHCPAIAFKRPDTIQYIISGFPNDTAICNGSSILIDPTIFPQGGVYNWGNGNNDTTLFVTITGDTTIYLSYTICDTTLTDSMKISLKTFVASFEQDTIKVCYGTDSLLLPLIGTNGDAPFKYQWTPIGMLSCDTCATPYGYLNPTGVTTFFLTVTDSNGCSASDNINVLVMPQLTAPILLTGQIHSCTANSIYCFAPSGVTYTINAPTATSITQINSDCFDIQWNINPDGSSNNEQFTVVITDDAGCQDSSQINLIACCGGLVNGQAFTITDEKASNLFGLYPSLGNVTANSFSTNWTGNPLPAYNTSDHVAINGTFEVDINYSIGESDVRFSPLSKIVVNSGVTLTIDPSYFHACQDSMWDGIYLKAGANLVVKGGYFEEALNAIVSENGAPYTIYKSLFNKNYIGILVQPYAGSHLGTIDSCIFTSKYSGLPFSPGTKLIKPFLGDKAHIGVDVRSVDTLRIGSPSFQPNVFDSLENGIRTSYSNTIIENNKFKYIAILDTILVPFAPLHRAIWVTNVASAGTSASNLHTVFVGGDLDSLQPNDFDSCQYGVWGNQSTHMHIFNNRFRDIFLAGVYYQGIIGGNLVEVRRNNFRNAYRGVVAWQNSICNSNIIYNTFWYPNSYNTTGIAVLAQETTNQRFNSHTMDVICNNIFGPKTGVKLVNMRLPNVIHNTIYPYALNSNIQTEGIRLDNAIGGRIERNFIRGNSTNSLHITGIRSDNSNSLLVTCNNPNFLGRGFVFSGSQPGTHWSFNTMFLNFYGLSLNQNGVIFPQKTILNGVTYPNENRWINAYLGSPYFHTIAENSSNGSFSDLTVRQSFFLSGYIPYKNTIDASIPTPSPVTYTTVNTNLGNGNCGPICSPSNSGGGVISDNLSITIAQGNLPITGSNAAAWWNWSRRHVFRNLIANSSLNDTLLIQYRDSLRNASMGVIDSISELLCVDTLNQSAVIGLQSANISAQPADTMQALQREVNGICLAKQISGSKVLTVQQFSQLQSIANMCPFTEGDAVYMARAIIDPLDTGNYVNPCEVLDNTVSSSRIAQPDVPVVNQQQVVAFNIYPNPSKGNFTIDYQLEQGGKMEVYDITGKMVKQIMLNSTNQREELKLDTEKGVYLYVLKTNQEVIKTGKLVIIN